MMSRTGTSGKNERRGGFTLIEMLLVILLLGLVLGMAAPVLRGAYRTVALDVAADRFVGLAAYARERAVMGRSRLRLEIETPAGAYRILREDPSIPGNFSPLPESLGRGSLLPEGTSVPSERVSFEFFPDGTVNGGPLTINGVLNEARRIDLNGLTGETEIYDVSPG